MKRIHRLLQEPEGPRAPASPVFLVGLLVVSLGVAAAGWQTKPAASSQPDVSPRRASQGLPATSTAVIDRSTPNQAPALLAQVRPVQERGPAVDPLAPRRTLEMENVRRQVELQYNQYEALPDTPYRKWLIEDVAYIIQDEERAAFKRLQSDPEREHFIEQFWQRRDPTPGTAENEYKEEHYRRIAYVNERFAAKIPGWKTDRGRVYIVYGPPDEITSHPAGTSQSACAGAICSSSTSAVPLEQWRYRYIQDVGTDILIDFVDPTLSGEYRMTSDPSQTDASLYQPGAGSGMAKAGTTVQVMSTGVGVGMNQSALETDKAKLADLLTRYTEGHPDVVSLRKKIAQDEANPEKMVLISVPLSGFASGPVNLIAVIATSAGRAVSKFTQSIPGPAPLYTRFVALQAGSYRLTVMIRDATTGKLAGDDVAFEVK
jgi:GWxTD domain-containing protein